jgi:DNA-binding NarL/FixJ family response regulator
MRISHVKKAMIRIAAVDTDPLRFIGFRTLLSSESDFDVQSVSLNEIESDQDVDVVLLGSRPGKNAFEVLSTMRAIRLGLHVILIGCNMDDAFVLKAIAVGAKGCVDEGASVSELARVIRIVHSGSVWAPRRILAMFVERALKSSNLGLSIGQRSFTRREKEVLRMLIAGCSNKEIAVPLGIEERTVKAHIAKLMRKVGVVNRVMLSTHVITHSLVPSIEG